MFKRSLTQPAPRTRLNWALILLGLVLLALAIALTLGLGGLTWLALILGVLGLSLIILNAFPEELKKP